MKNLAMTLDAAIKLAQSKMDCQVHWKETFHCTTDDGEVWITIYDENGWEPLVRTVKPDGPVLELD